MPRHRCASAWPTLWATLCRDAASPLVVRPLDGVAVEFGERHEGNNPTAVDIHACDLHGPVGLLLLDDLEQTLGARRPNGDHHDAPQSQLLQQRWRNVVYAAGDDDLVERGRLRPAVVAVGMARGNPLIFAVTALDQPIQHTARALRERFDDLDAPHLVREIGKIRGLVARSGANLEYLLAKFDVERGRHAADNVRAGDRHAEADVEKGVVVGASLVTFEGERLARCHEKGALVALIEHVVIDNQHLIAAEALRQEVRLLASVRHHPLHESLTVGGRRGCLPTVGLGNSPGERCLCSRAEEAGCTGQKCPTSQALLPLWLPWPTRVPSHFARPVSLPLVCRFLVFLGACWCIWASWHFWPILRARGASADRTLAGHLQPPNLPANLVDRHRQHCGSEITHTTKACSSQRSMPQATAAAYNHGTPDGVRQAAQAGGR